MLSVNGIFVGLELKRSSKAKISELQIYNVERINNTGAFAAVVYPENLNEIMQILENISNA